MKRVDPRIWLIILLVLGSWMLLCTMHDFNQCAEPSHATEESC